MVCLGNKQRSFFHSWDCIQYCISESFVDYEGYYISSKGFLPTVVDIRVIWINLSIPVHFSSLILKMSMFTLAISCLTTSNLHWFMDLTFQVPMQYCSLQPLDLTSITSHIHNWALFLLWVHPFILSGVISPLISSSILGTYWPGQFIFQCAIFLPFTTVHGVLKVRILKWLAIKSTVEIKDLASQVAQWWRTRLPMQETWIWSLRWEDSLEKEIATHSSMLAWEIPWI